MVGGSEEEKTRAKEGYLELKEDGLARRIL